MGELCLLASLASKHMMRNLIGVMSGSDSSGGRSELDSECESAAFTATNDQLVSSLQ